MNDRHSSPPQAVADAMRALCWAPSTDHDIGLIAYAVEAELGAVLEATVLSKTLCLLAAHLDHTPVTRLPRPAARFFASTLRTNRHKTAVYRSHAITVTTALRTAGITAAVLGGLSVEHTLYGGTGARQFNDIDLLIEPQHIARTSTILHNLSYYPTAHRSWIRTLNDPLIPVCVIDLTTHLPHTHDDTVDDLLSRHVEQLLPDHNDPLPVLAPADALEYSLARLGQATNPGQVTNPDTGPDKNRPRWLLTADALRLWRAARPSHGEYATPAMHGWTALRRIWPQLPTDPASTHPTARDTR
jgi:Uncharacterised nucleotidyltransferase